MDLDGKQVLVVGSGISGVAASELLIQKGIKTVIFDGNSQMDTDAFRKRNPHLSDVRIILGELTEQDIKETDLVVISPGVPVDQPMIAAASERGIPVWGEIELAYYFSKGKICAITGTNGKTTTTALTGEILSNYYKDVKVVGNIGIPYTSVAAGTTDESVTVAEISSFQLETIHAFRPDVSAILNITPDHLDRHHTMECYIKMKERITQNQTGEQICVLNYEDDILRSFGECAPLSVMYFSSARTLKKGLYLEGGTIYYSDGMHKVKIIHTGDLNILGTHNYENAMAAAGIAIGMGVPVERITEALKSFQAVEHRIEYVTEKSGIRFYNDSKGTNPDAAVKGIKAMNRPTYLIGGGYDKQSKYDAWIDSFDGKVKKLVLIGQTREKIAECAKKHGFTNIFICDTLEDAVKTCYENAKDGDAILLSPACASWGMFKNYEERGCRFKEIVHSLKEKRM